MYVLHAANIGELFERSQLFDQYMEPLLARLVQYDREHDTRATLPEIKQYLQVCRWPFRKLEYSFALDVLLNHLQVDDSYLDAGSGVTPFAHIFAERGIEAHACDAQARLISALQELDPETIYGSRVSYSVQDLTKPTYPDASFHAISCISVLEHIPAPHDQIALKELLRLLKPGGVLVLTVDFTPPPRGGGQSNRLGYYANRTARLVRQGDFGGIVKGIGNKLNASRAVSNGSAHHPRSANECFRVEHLQQDILPALKGQEIASHLPFTRDLKDLSPAKARSFWELEAGLYDSQGRRNVLPAAVSIYKEWAS